MFFLIKIFFLFSLKRSLSCSSNCHDIILNRDIQIFLFDAGNRRLNYNIRIGLVNIDSQLPFLFWPIFWFFFAVYFIFSFSFWFCFFFNFNFLFSCATFEFFKKRCLAELPKGKVLGFFDSTDIYKAKEMLGNNMCISGMMPVSLLQIGTTQMIKDYAKKLIDVVGKEGGFIMGPGSTMEECDPERVKIWVKFTKKYGVYA